MGIRQKLNEKPGLSTALVALFVIGAVGLVFWQIPHKADPGGEDFFTTDDGANWFTDAATNIPPYDKGGKQAVKVNLFKCADGKIFVGYLEKYSDDAKKKIQSATAGKPPALDRTTMTLVKKPGEGNWVNGRDPNFAKIKDVHCPGSNSTEYEPVLP